MLEKYPDILTVDDLIQILRLGKNSVYRLLISNEIQHRKVGRKYLIPKRCVLAYIEQVQQVPANTVVDLS